MSRHHGSLEELKAAVERAGCVGQWQEQPNSCWRFVNKDRAGLNWSESKGTLWFDGPADAKVKLQATIEAVLNGGTPRPPLLPR